MTDGLVCIGSDRVRKHILAMAEWFAGSAISVTVTHFRGLAKETISAESARMRRAKKGVDPHRRD